jgi:hypothetical protein
MLAALAGPLLAGCPPNIENVIAGSLADAGLPWGVARCVADRVTDRFDDRALRGLYSALWPRRASLRGPTLDAALPQLRPFVTADVYALFEQAGRDCNTRR